MSNDSNDSFEENEIMDPMRIGVEMSEQEMQEYFNDRKSGKLTPEQQR